MVPANTPPPGPHISQPHVRAGHPPPADPSRSFRSVVVASVRRLYERLISSCSGSCLRGRRVQVADSVPLAAAARRTGAYGDGLAIQVERMGRDQGQGHSAILREADFFTIGYGAQDVVHSPPSTPPSTGRSDVSPVRRDAKHGDSKSGYAADVQRMARIEGVSPSEKLVTTGRDALATVEDWLVQNPSNESNSGSSLFRAQSPATQAITSMMNLGCVGAFERLIQATVRDAITEIQVAQEKLPKPWFRAAPALGQVERERILLHHVSRNFVGGSPQPSPMRQAVPVEVRAFLKAIRDAVAGWQARDVTGGESSRYVVPGALILRGAAAWASKKAASHPPGDSRDLSLALSRMLMSLATTGTFKSPTDATGAPLPGSPELTEAVNALKPRFQSELAAVAN